MSSDRSSRVMQLAAKARNLLESDRADYLRRECGGDFELAGEVVALLSADSSALDSNATVQSNPTEDPKGLGHVPSQTNTQHSHYDRPVVAGYDLLRQIGVGGMGFVWEAIQLGTGRRVAVKLMRPELLSSDHSKKRFTREVELMASLDHPHIAKVYESGLHQGLCYYAMELVDGLPLDKYVREYDLTQRQILALVRDICRAVQHAHERRVVHRDLKPSNVLIRIDGQPRVLDFGLAKLLSDGQALASMTADGSFVGTLAYMASEQAAGKSELIDARTDVCALGVVLFHAITGELPRDMSGDAIATIRRISMDPPHMLSSLLKNVDRDLDAVVAKAMCLDPSDRYADAGELADDLTRYLEGKPTIARKLGLIAQFYGWCRQPERIAMAGRIQAIVGSLAGLFHLFYLLRAGQEWVTGVNVMLTPHSLAWFAFWNAAAVLVYGSWVLLALRVLRHDRFAAWISFLWSTQHTAFNLAVWSGWIEMTIGGILLNRDARAPAYAMFTLVSMTVASTMGIALVALYRNPLIERQRRKQFAS